MSLAFARFLMEMKENVPKDHLNASFLPQPVAKSCLLLWFNAIGIPLSWHTAFAHLVWITCTVSVKHILVQGAEPLFRLFCLWQN